MIKKYLLPAFTVLLMFAVNALMVPAQSKTDGNASTVEKIKAAVLKRGTGEKSKVSVKMSDGTKMKGYISQVGEDSFDLTNSKTKQTTAVAYRDVAQVKKQGLSTGAKIAIFGGLAAVVTVVVIGIAVNGALDNLGGFRIAP